MTGFVHFPTQSSSFCRKQKTVVVLSAGYKCCYRTLDVTKTRLLHKSRPKRTLRNSSSWLHMLYIFSHNFIDSRANVSNAFYLVYKQSRFSGLALYCQSQYYCYTIINENHRQKLEILSTSGMLRSVNWFRADVSGLRNRPIFKGQDSSYWTS